MKVRNKLMLLIATCLLLFGSVVYHFNKVIMGNTQLLLKQRCAEAQTEFSSLLDNSVLPIKSFVKDKASWADMQAYIQGKKNDDWLLNNVSNISQQIGIQYLCVTDQNFNPKFSALLSDSKKNDFFFNKNDLQKNLNATKDVQFYTSYNNQLLRVSASPIINNNNTLGYLLAAEIIDTNKLKGWQKQLANSTLLFEKANAETEPDYDLKKGEVSFNMAFLDANLQPITSIKVIKNSDIYSTFAADFKSNLLFFILCCVGFATVCLFFFIIWVNLPLQKIAAALNRGDAAAIKNLEKSNTEFGDLSRVVKNSFKQKQDLLNEIESRKLMVEALKKAMGDMEIAQLEKQKAEKSDIAKSLFLSTMSHEIRTPINGVIGIANLLLCENPSPSQERYIKLLEFSAKHLKLLVDDILDFSKIEAGKFEFSKVEFNMHNLMNDIYATNQLRALEKGIELKIETDKTLNNNLIGDNLRFNQVVTNLLSNAIKFTDEGSVTIKFQHVETTDRDTIIQLSVTDTGIGMTPEQCNNLFKEFTQANMEVNRKYGGTGLGLAISKKLVELQGGNIAASSEMGKGSTFMVNLKFGLGGIIEAEKVIISRQKSMSDKNLEKLNVLVAEDNKINSFVVKQFLTKWNVGELDFAENGQEAFEMAKLKTYDLILMDLQMPTVDGYEATHKIRESEGEYLKTIPIIALSADASSETKNRVLDLGFSGYITKPFDPDELFKEMMKVTMQVA
ncbi:MAG: hypothetical protein RI955_1109 [Bacteroidota bacterium]